MPTDMEREVKTRASKTSPRTNAFMQVITLIEKRIAQATKEGDTDMEEILTDLRDEVQGLIGTQLKPSAVKSEDGDEPELASGNHFVGVKEDKTVVYVSGKDYPTMHDLTAVFGPFRTEAGAMYAITHDTFRARSQVL